MAQTFKETAHLKINLEKYGENYDNIDWTYVCSTEHIKSLHAEAPDTKQNERQIPRLFISQSIKRFVRKAWLYLKGNCLGCL